MPLGNFVPASVRYGRSVFPAQPEQEGLSSEMAGTLQSFQAGQPQFDPSSLRQAPVPLGTQSTPANAARGVSPGGLGGGIDASALPFSVRAGLGTGGGMSGGGVGPSPTSPAGTSSVVGNMLSQTMSGGGSGGGGTGFMSSAPSPSPNVTIGGIPQSQVLAMGPNALSNPALLDMLAALSAGTPESSTSNDAGGLDRSVGSPDLAGFGA